MRDLFTSSREKAARRIRRLIATSIVSLGAAVAMAGPASAAGFFETLFGVRQQQPAVYYAPRHVPNVPLVMPDRRDPDQQARRAQARAKAKAKAKAIAARATERVAADVRSVQQVKVAPQVLGGPLGPFLLDPTLRRGDVVVTTQGLQVFTGAPSGQHSAAEFAPLAQASQLVKGNFTVLAAIDRANRFSDKPLVAVQTVPAAPAAKPVVEAGRPARRAAL